MLRALRYLAVSIGICGIAVVSAQAQDFQPDVDYDPSIPTVNAVLGSPAGARITPSADVVAYFRALEDAAPDRIKVVDMGRSWQGRELVYAVIASPENMESLEDIQDGMRRLADPRTTPPREADALIDELPGSVWLAYSVHGNEISPSDAAMITAYHLLAAEDDDVVESILDNAIVFIDPVQNPDGRDRFVNHYYDTLGLEPSGSAISAERNERWPSGRVNHYLFDMNRDWFALTQPETRARVAAFLDWMPLIFVDLHEMGTNSTFYFAPEADPYNPDITASQREALDVIGRNNARYFEREGFAYYTREVFDAQYPGYGAAWPLFHGAIGTTYEQASARGLLATRSDGTTLTYAKTVLHHFTASLATAETAAVNRERFLREFYDYRSSAISEGAARDDRTYIIPRQTDQGSADKLAAVLAAQGIEVFEANETITACRTDFDAGAYVIGIDQPAGRLARNILAADVAVDPEFMEEQERRRAKGLSVELYDVTAWSMPLMYNLEVATCAASVSGDLSPVEPTPIRPGALINPDAELAFLAPWGSTSAVRLLAASLNAGITVHSTDLPFTLDDQEYPAGTLIFPIADNSDDLADRLATLADASGADVIGVDSGWVSSGPNFGSDNVVKHLAPRVAIAWDTPTNPLSAGATRFVLERQLGYPTIPIRTDDLGSDLLDTFDVLILPDGGNYANELGKNGVETLGAWVRRGGVLIALDDAIGFVAHEDTGLSSLRRELAAKGDAGGESGSGPVDATLITSAEELGDAQTPATRSPDYALGVLAKAQTDFDHWMSAGIAPTVNVLMRGSAIYAPLSRDNGHTVVSFAGPDDVAASGYWYEETRAQLAHKPFVTVEPTGRGYVIAFTQDPTVRGYLDGLNVLLANAVFRGAAHASPPR